MKVHKAIQDIFDLVFEMCPVFHLFNEDVDIRISPEKSNVFIMLAYFAKKCIPKTYWICQSRPNLGQRLELITEFLRLEERMTYEMAKLSIYMVSSTRIYKEYEMLKDTVVFYFQSIYFLLLIFI